MGATLSQLYPPSPTLTEANLLSQSGKTFVITGGTSGIGFELAKLLYGAGGNVVITGRTEPSVLRAVSDIKNAFPPSQTETADIDGVHMDLSNLSEVKDRAHTIGRMTSYGIDVLFLNAGVSQPPIGSTTVQGHELQVGVNCLGHLLLAHCLLPSLVSASQRAQVAGEAPGSVRIVWASSQTVDMQAPKGGFNMQDIINPPKDQVANYVNSKLGNWYLAHYFSQLPTVQQNNILSVTQNPGNVKSNLLRNARWMYWAAWPLLYPAKMGAFTELWAGLSGELGIEDQVAYIIPWGRRHTGLRDDLLVSMRCKEEGGTGRAQEFAEWCEEQIREFR